ncbi:ribonuclease HII [Sulfolobus acidocaldarius]|uniref:Ribonuclease HII n=4 Tax=Sulfolobus acidocaldarius TaxID=2285 RepID=RNH2_SULAC|nr:ribonuclease HII [Sulfolobus acidocaldarius]Q4JA60.1 RecName: Full=Ribonuclease HII; Short=RNase HII [Sulfolobus acidocaldarius DSM 639]AAY80320.1 ribonuclease HII [Sulfolobus acidocaldarius DSM 639]AGE70901.1 ribonuclease HII [Sulfolobus acidocaldarius N8]AGE73172.1 ribonuclease HII [Sulfolobus acidocaldarius Ron12/I]ALU28792.1 ribonuclease HII [Sulfolobus acidocaldarius]ALU31512.1 ribonuclease HII [Sulfolobus acidocaldarius]
MILVGIDEAGRGSLIGPMVVAGVAIDSNFLKFLSEIGVKDSKKLTRKKREYLFGVILEYSYAISLVKAYPEEIDSENLNEITYRAMIQIIHSMSVYNPSIVTVDKVGNASAVEREIININSSPRVENNADVKYVEVSAASIIAKVVRDNIINELKKTYGDFGSGYPGDKKTVEWIKDLYSRQPTYALPIIRRSWKILQDIAPNYYIRKRDGN